MENTFREILLKAAREMGLAMTEEHMALFETYRETLLLWGGRMNLVSLQSELDLPVRHFIDSLTLLPYLTAGPGTLLDIGSGAGFPAIPVKIFRKDLRVTLLEASRKKCSFLKEVIRRLGLRDVEVLNCRLEELLKKDPLPSFDRVVSRAALKLPELVELGVPLLKPGGILAAMKGPAFEAEAEALNSSESNNFRLVGSFSFTLPVTGDQRHIILVDKPR
jgi:16S rRNA (guanine527-N7)-methyltransferase